MTRVLAMVLFVSSSHSIAMPVQEALCERAYREYVLSTLLPKLIHAQIKASLKTHQCYRLNMDVVGPTKSSGGVSDTVEPLATNQPALQGCSPRCQNRLFLPPFDFEMLEPVLAAGGVPI